MFGSKNLNVGPRKMRRHQDLFYSNLLGFHLHDPRPTESRILGHPRRAASIDLITKIAVAHQTVEPESFFNFLNRITIGPREFKLNKNF
jgi:hypothetical protein